MLYLCCHKYEGNISCATHSLIPEKSTQTSMTLGIMQVTQGSGTSYLNWDAEGTPKILFILGRDEAFRETKKKKRLLGMPFLICIPVTSTHVRSMFHVLKKYQHYIKDATPGIPESTGSLMDLQAVGQFEVPLMASGASGLTSIITDPYASPRPALVRLHLSGVLLILPALGAPPGPQCSHTVPSPWARRCAGAVFPLSQALAKISRQGLMNPKDLWW